MGHCLNCGAELRPSANFCTNCGAAVTAAAASDDTAVTAEPLNERAGGGPVPASPPPAPAAGPASPRKIENHLIRSVIATVCCCVPFGVAGIIYAVKVDALLRQGDLAAAEDASKKAGLWSVLAIGVGLTLNVLIAVLTVYYQFKEEGLL